MKNMRWEAMGLVVIVPYYSMLVNLVGSYLVPPMALNSLVS